MPYLYLLDASAVIEANNDYFSMDRIAPYWDWLLAKATEGIVKTPDEIYQEMMPSFRPDIKENSTHHQRAKRNLFDWTHRQDVPKQFILDEQLDRNVHEQVLSRGYGENLEEKDYLSMGKDSILIAYAKKQPNRIVVTKERSKPSKMKGNRKIPDVCKDLGIGCIDDYEFQRRCDFRIP